MATSVKLGVDVSAFKAGIKDAQANVKALGAELKRNEAQFKATGNAEQYMTDKTRLLKMQMTAQKNEITNLENALKKMREAGVTPTSAAYQNMQRQLSDAQTSLLNMSVELNNVAVSEQNAAKGADQMANSLGSIGKKMSLQQVINGIDKITGGLEKAAKKAIDLGKAIWDNITDSARMADDTATAAMMLDMDVEKYQQYKGVFDTIAEMTVQDWKKAEQKVRKAIYDPSQDQIDVLEALGIKTHGQVDTGFGMAEGLAKDWETVFWEATQKLQSMVERNPANQDLADTWGEALFGKNFSSLKGLIGLGKEGFAAALEEQAAASAEAIQKDAELNDQLIKLKASYEALQLEVTSGLAPALTGAAQALDGMLTSLLEYLQKPEGQKLLEDMGTAVSGLFDDLGEIDPEKVVSGFKGVFDSIVGGLQWMVDNEETLKNILIGIVGTWGTAKLVGGALDVLNLVNGLTGLSSAGAREAAATAGAAVGSSWGGAFAAAVLAAAPWLLSILAANAIPDDQKLGKEERVEAATYTESDIRRLREWVHLQNELLQVNAAYGTEGFDASKFNLLSNMIAGLGDVQHGDLWNRYWDYLMANDIMPGFQTMPTEFLDKMFKETTGGEYTPPKIEVLPEPAPGTQEMIQEKLNMMKLKVVVEVEPFFRDAGGRTGGRGGGMFREDQFHANGLPLVPWDGYPAILHKGERVLTAQQNRNYTANSNTYFEHVTVNNGMDADALAGRIAAAQQRAMSGFGS